MVTGAPTVSDDVLLLHAMLLVAGAEGTINEAEKGLLEGHFCSLPELKGKDFRALYHQAEALLKTYPTRPAAAAALGQMTGQRAKEKAYWLATDMALCSGDLAPATRDMWSRVEAALGIDAELARKIREVIALKYLRQG